MWNTFIRKSLKTEIKKNIFFSKLAKSIYNYVKVSVKFNNDNIFNYIQLIDLFLEMLQK